MSEFEEISQDSRGQEKRKLLGLRYIGIGILCQGKATCDCVGEHTLRVLNSPFLKEGESYFESGAE